MLLPAHNNDLMLLTPLLLSPVDLSWLPLILTCSIFRLPMVTPVNWLSWQSKCVSSVHLDKSSWVNALSEQNNRFNDGAAETFSSVSPSSQT